MIEKKKFGLKLLRPIMFIVAFFLFLVALGGPFESPIHLGPIMDWFVPDYLDHPEKRMVPLWVNLLVVVIYISFTLLALMFVLLILSIFSKRCSSMLTRLISAYTSVISPLHRYFIQPLIKTVDKLLASLILSAIIMMILLTLDLWKESAEQIAALFLASLLFLSAIFQNRIIFNKFRKL